MTPVQKIHEFVKTNLEEVCKDQWQLETTGILPSGAYRQAQKYLEENLSIDGCVAMSVVKSVLLTELIKFRLDM